MSSFDNNFIPDEEIGRNKISALLAYIIFFIPLVWTPNSSFARFHANQGLVLFLSTISINIIGSIMPIVGWMIIIPFGNFFVFILALLGIINAATGKKKRLPIVGAIKIIDR